MQLGRVAGGDNPVEDRQLDHKTITVKELCTRYRADLQAGLILGKEGRPKKPSTITTDTGRIERHIIPILGPRRVKDLIMAADTISGYIQGLLDGTEFRQTTYALDRDSRKAVLARFLKRALGGEEQTEEERRMAA